MSENVSKGSRFATARSKTSVRRASVRMAFANDVSCATNHWYAAARAAAVRSFSCRATYSSETRTASVLTI